MPDFQIVDELPTKSAQVFEHPDHENPTKPLIRFLIANPNSWVKVRAYPKATPKGNTNAAPFARAKGLRSWGLQTEIRSIDDTYTVFARLAPGATQDA